MTTHSKIFSLLLASSTILLIAACTPQADKDESLPTKPLSVNTIQSEQLQNMMAVKDFTLINVHIPYEGEIENTDAFMPFNEIENLIDLPKDAKIVLYCRSGSMSAIAAEKLISLGYSNVSNLENGMIEWKSAGNSILDKPQTIIPFSLYISITKHGHISFL